MGIFWKNCHIGLFGHGFFWTTTTEIYLETDRFFSQILMKLNCGKENPLLSGFQNTLFFPICRKLVIRS